MKKAIVAGSIVLDIEPVLIADKNFKLEQGKLNYLSDIQMHVGGVVGNTGLALGKLGIPTHCYAIVGKDRNAELIKLILADEKVTYTLFNSDTEERGTSTSIILAIPGQDRILLNYSGVSRQFDENTLNIDSFPEESALFHFAYPPNMERLVDNKGIGFCHLLDKIHRKGIATSVDMCFPSPNSSAMQQDWKVILNNWLPSIDFFLPSIEEMLIFLDKPYYEERNKECAGRNLIDFISIEEVQKIGKMIIDMGCPIVCLKVGKKGMYLRTADCLSVRRIPQVIKDYTNWANREIWFPPCAVKKIVSAKGAGDTAIAGFISAILKGMDPIDTLSIASLTAGCCIQTVDAISGIPPIEVLVQRIIKGFPQETIKMPDNWIHNGYYYIGSSDANYHH